MEGASWMEFPFQDEIFTPANEKRVIVPPKLEDFNTYKPPFHQPQWYLGEPDSYNTLRMQGAHFYMEKCYSSALQCYERSLELCSDNSLCTWETSESMVRCFIKLNNYNKAQQLAEQLEKLAQNYDQQIVTWYLMVAVHEGTKNGDLAIQYITLLLTQIPASAALWTKLGLLFDAGKFAGYFACKKSSFTQFKILCLIRAEKLLNKNLLTVVGEAERKNLEELGNCGEVLQSFPEHFVSTLRELDDKRHKAGTVDEDGATHFTYQDNVYKNKDVGIYIHPNTYSQSIGQFWDAMNVQ